MDAGERALARLSGRARSRGYPALQHSRTASELTGGNWHRKPEAWGVDTPQKLSKTRDELEPRQKAVEMTAAPVAAAAPTNEVLVAPTSLQRTVAAAGLSPKTQGFTEVLPERVSSMTAAPTMLPTEEEPLDEYGDPFGIGMPPEMPPPLPPPSSPPAAPVAAPASTSTSAGSVLTVGALLAAFLFS